MQEIHIILTIDAKGIHGAEIAKSEQHLTAPHLVFRSPSNAEYASITAGIQAALSKDKMDVLVQIIDKMFVRIEHMDDVTIVDQYLTSWQYTAIAMQLMEAVKPDSREMLYFRSGTAPSTKAAT